MINKANSEKNNSVELKPSSKIRKQPGNFSNAIGNLIAEISQQFGDDAHRLSNIKQAVNCWEKSKLDEREFVQLLYRVRSLTLQHTNAVSNPAQAAKARPDRSFSSWVTLAGVPAKDELPRSETASPLMPRNRMPYFFKVLQDLVSRPAESPVEAAPQVKSELPVKPEATLHKPKRVKPLIEQGKPSQPVETAPVVIPPQVESLPAKSEVPPELIRMSERFASDVELAVEGWQRWQNSLKDMRLQSIARKMLPLARSQIRPELQTLLFPPETQSFIMKQEFLLVFRNAFDARYAASFLGEIGQSLSLSENCEVEIFITCL